MGIQTLQLDPEAMPLDEARRRLGSFAHLRREFPTVIIELGRASGDAACVTRDAWRADDADFFGIDEQVHRELARGVSTLAVRGLVDDLPQLALEVLTRYQGQLDRRNESSTGEPFDAVLAAHAALHDLSKPLVRADLLHALDCWQWLLRLAPDASLALQMAALFHDVERLRSEADARVEHRAPDYQAFKDAHARGGASMVRRALEGVGLASPIVERVSELVAHHERPGNDPELALLNDADAISFFSLNCHGYLNYFGPAQTAKKVAYTFARLSARHRGRLDEVRLPNPVRAMVEALKPARRAHLEGLA